MGIMPEKPEVNYNPLAPTQGFSASGSTAEKPKGNSGEVPVETSNIISSPNGSKMEGGDFQSSNFVEDDGGWKLDSQGNFFSPFVRLGNLNGLANFTTDTYGIFVGNFSTGKYMSYDSDSGNLVVNGYIQTNIGAFGGDGSDGALDTSGGTVDINAASANVVVKNYTSINIQTNDLTLSNPANDGTILILKSQGDVTIDNAAIDLEGDGAQAETDGYSILDDTDHFGGTGSNQDPATGGSGGAILDNTSFYVTPDEALLYRKFLNLACGSGGGNGGNGEKNDNPGTGGTGGAGGRGGGALIIECAGALDFQADGEINVNGGTGSVGGDGGSSEGDGGGGGGGSAGMALVLYKTLTANAGTINAKGGAGGDGGDAAFGGFSQTGGGGGGGAGAWTAAGETGGTGGTSGGGGAATNGTNTNDAAGAGGGGGSGSNSTAGTGGGTGGTQGATDANHYLVAENKYFA